MVACEGISLEIYINNHDISKIILHNYIIYYGEPTYVGFFTILFRDAPDILRFPIVYWVKTHFF